MKTLKVLLVGALFVFLPARLPADTQATDPRVIINDPSPLACPSVGLTFSFMSDSTGSGTLCFTNASGKDWFFLEVNVPTPPPAHPLISCGGTAFSSCFRQVTFTEAGFATFDFNGSEVGDKDIDNGETFGVDLGTAVCTSFSDCWTPFSTFTADAHAPDVEPEPGTITLFITGLASLLWRLRRNACG